MKKKVIVAVAVLICCVTFGIVCICNWSYWTTCSRKIEIDENLTTQSVLTFNVKCISDSDKDEYGWQNRAALICDVLQDKTPSIICLQENKKEQYRFFKSFLSGYDSVAIYRDSSALTECLPIFYRSDMYLLEQTQTFWLSDTPDVMSNTWDGAYYRICTYVVLKNKITDKEFVVANTHLDYKSAEIQEKSIKLIYDRLSKLNLPTILTGDFNCRPNSNAISLAKQHFTDVGKGFADENKGTINYFRSDYKDVKIDFMLQLNGSFVVDEYRVIDKKIDGAFPSDHFPIYAEIR